MIKPILLKSEARRGPFWIREEWWWFGPESPKQLPPGKLDEPSLWELMKSAYSADGVYVGEVKDAMRLWKKYGIERFYKLTRDGNVASVGYSPRRKKWYGWSHRAIYGYKTRCQAERFAERMS